MEGLLHVTSSSKGNEKKHVREMLIPHGSIHVCLVKDKKLDGVSKVSKAKLWVFLEVCLVFFLLFFYMLSGSPMRTRQQVKVSNKCFLCNNLHQNFSEKNWKVSAKNEVRSLGGISKTQSKVVITEVTLPRFSGRLKYSPTFL